MTDASAQIPPEQDTPPPVEDAIPAMTPVQRAVKILALYIFPVILLGLLIAVVVGVVRLGVSSRSADTAPISEIPTTLAAAPDVVTTPDPVSELDRLQANVDGRHSSASMTTNDYSTYPDMSVLSRLSDRIDRLEAAQAQTAQDAQRVRDAMALERAAQGSAPFRAELDRVADGLNEPGLLLPLRPLADRGVPTVAMLVLSYPKLAARAHSAAQSPPGAGDPLGWLGQWFGAIVSVRRTDITEGSDAVAILNRAEALLNTGDLSGAVTELEALPSQARNVLKPWLDQAKERLIVDEATRGITEIALSRLGQTRLGQNSPAPIQGGDQ